MLAEELVQETFLAALKARERFAGNSSEKTWMVGILKHKIVDYLRKAVREQPYDESIQGLDEIQNESFDGKGHWKIDISRWNNPDGNYYNAVPGTGLISENPLYTGASDLQWPHHGA